MPSCGDCINFVCTLSGKCNDGKWEKFCETVQKVVSEDSAANSSCFSPWRVGSLRSNT